MNKTLLLAFAAAAAPAAFAHVSLVEPRAAAGARYEAVFRVGHGCDDSPTKALRVRVPAGFTLTSAAQKLGWSVTQSKDMVTWTADADTSLAPKEKGEFVLVGQAPAQPQDLWFKVLQTCAKGAIDWADLPKSGASTEGMKSPAVLLNVVAQKDFAAASRLPRIEGGWVRAAVPGQSGTGAFMRITAPEAMRLVAVESPAARVAEVHEMKMEGDVMKMRALPFLELPAGQAVELRPGGNHLMLQELVKALSPGQAVPVTLVFRNASGAEVRQQLTLPVQASAQQPTGGAAAAPGGHKH